MDTQKNYSFLKTLLINIIYIIIIPIILYDMFLIVKTLINPKETPDLFGIKTFSIISQSMEPTINKHDIVIVNKVNEEDIKTNDIITFKINNEIITHRIVSIDKENYNYIYTTKGDNNEVSDIEKIDYNQIEGKVIATIPKIGAILTILKNKIVFAIILILLIISYYWQKRTITKKIARKEKRKKFERKKDLH